MAAIYMVSGIRARPIVTEHDHAKKSPAISAVTVAVRINIRFAGVIIERVAIVCWFNRYIGIILK
jgi:hypothetical protein